MVLGIGERRGGFALRRSGRWRGQPRLADQEIPELVDLLLADHALLERVEQLGLIVVDDAFPIVDDDGAGALIGAPVDLGAFVGHVRIGDRYDELAVAQPIAVEYRLHGGGGPPPPPRPPPPPPWGR